jgi:small-conductance mechanosensitive channel
MYVTAGLFMGSIAPQAWQVTPAYGQTQADSQTPASSDTKDIEPGDDMQTKPGTVGRMLERATPETGSPVVDNSVGRLFKAISKMIDGLIGVLPNIVVALIFLCLVFVLARIASKIVERVSLKARLRRSLVDLFRIFAKVGIWVAGLVMAAGIVFPEFGVGQIMTTAGLASVAVGFAFKDIFENFFAGILILWRFPFENGDFIEVNDMMGKVEDVEIRMTRMRKPDGELLLIPNGTIFKDPVRVITDRDTHRVEVSVGVAYGEDVGEAREVILKAVKACDRIDTATPPEVLLDGFGASSMDFDVLFWCDPKPLESRRARDQVVEAIKRALDEAGIEIPYPYRTLTFTDNEPSIIEAVRGRGGRASEEGRSAE